MEAYESIFLSRTRTHLEQSLGLADRLPHFMWASVILACHYGHTGRVLESYNTMSATVRFAIGCGLHQHGIDGSESIELAPEDNIECEDPSSLWYAIYLTDAAITSGTGLPTALPQEVRLLIKWYD